MGNSAALLAGRAGEIAALAARHGMKAMLRPGLALYGLIPRFDPEFDPPEPPSLAAARARLHPVLAWKTRVVGVRSVPAGAVVGYNGTFVATEPMRLALVAVGLRRRPRPAPRQPLQPAGSWERAPLVGRISMDQAVLDVTEIPGVAAGRRSGDPGRAGQRNRSPPSTTPRPAGTIPWEVFTRIGARVPRVAV